MLKTFKELKKGDYISYIYIDDITNKVCVDRMLVTSIDIGDNIVLKTIVVYTNYPWMELGYEETHYLPKTDFNRTELGPLLLSNDDQDVSDKCLKVQAENIQASNKIRRHCYKRRNITESVTGPSF